jgi:hypothetical protein
MGQPDMQIRLNSSKFYWNKRGRNTKSPTFAELFADRGHPGPKIFKLKFVDF